MPTTNPGRGRLKPHLRMVRRLWVVAYRDRDGTIFSEYIVSPPTTNSRKAVEAKVWCASRNARIVANQ